MKSARERLNNAYRYTFWVLSVLFSFVLIFQLAYAATGEVQFSVASQYQFGTSGSYLSNGNTIAKVFDNDLTTWWDAPTPSSVYAGLDLTAAAQVTKLRIAPRPGYIERIIGVTFQGANVSSSSGPWTTLYTFAYPPLPIQNQYIEVPINTSGNYYRYYRVVDSTNSYGSIAEVRMIGYASSTTPYVPVTPRIYPMGGRYENNTKVSLMSSTTDATIYYTTDGTTPTYSGGSPQGTTQTYSTPFTVTSTGTTTVKAIAVSSGTYVSEVSDPAYFFISPTINSGLNWYDQSGHLIEGHDGSISYFNGTYYWYGQNYNNSSPQVEKTGIKVYSSPDLINWTDLGTALYINTSTTIRRPNVIYNSASSTYVMWAQNQTSGRAIVATSTSPAGPFNVYTSSYNPDGVGFTECNLFKDDDGTAYVAYAESARNYTYISKLSIDYLSVTGNYVRPYTSAAKSAAPALFKRGSVYFFIMNQNYNAYTAVINNYATSSSVLGTWSTFTNPFQSSASEDNTVAFHSQTSSIISVNGRTDGYIYFGDRFDGTTLYNSRYVWLPITFPTANTMSISWNSSWTLNSAFTTATAPQAATNLSATKAGLNTSLTWTNNQSISYAPYLDRATDSGFTQNLVSFPLVMGTTTALDTTVVDGTKYYYRLRTVTGAGSTNSSSVTADYSFVPDTIYPTVAVTTPSSQSTIYGHSVTLTASSSDNILVSSVQFKVDGISVGSSGTTSPYSITWDSATVSDGSHTITAVATDSSDNASTSVGIVITVNNSLYRITPTPSSVIQNSTSTTISLAGIATSWTSGTPGSPTFTLSGGTGASIVSQSISDTSTASMVLNAGSTVGTLIITDPSTNATSTISVYADTTAPTIHITVPTDGGTLVGHSVTLTATSSDNVAVTSVQFKIDGTSIGSSGTTSPYSITWDSATVLDGSHTLTAVATDGAGNSTVSNSLTVIVNNSVAPTVSTGAASSLLSFSTVLNGSIDVTGGASSTVRGFELGLTTSYGTTISETGSFLTGSFSTTTSSLSCSATYHYRAFSTNLSGTSYGSDRAFQTATCPVANVGGEIQFSVATPYQLGSSDTGYLNSGNRYANVFDQDLTTWYDSSSASANYVGLDLTVAGQITRLRFAPRIGYTVLSYGMVLQGSNVSSTTGPWTTIYTVPAFPPYYAQRQMNEITVSTGGSTYRYYRLVGSTSSYGNIAEVRFLGLSGTTTPYIPVAPVATPKGGTYSGPMRVRLSSLTNDATIYYTNDGTTPTFANGNPTGTTQLYSSPLTISATTTIKAIAVSNGTFVSDVSDSFQFYVNNLYLPGQDWLDTDGHLIESHDGEVKYFNGKYYWYGQIFNANSPEIEAVGVSAYSSTDLINWKDEGPIIYLGRSYKIERPHVIYNESTHKYVMWGHNVLSGTGSMAVVAYNDSPIGRFTVATTTYNPDGLGLNDMNLYQDDDGSAYLLYSSAADSNSHFYISKLSSDYLTTSGVYTNPTALHLREAPAVVKRNGVYFMMTSGLTGWPPNTNTYSTSTSMLGTWSTNVNPFTVSSDEDYTLAYHSQTTNILPIPGRGDAYIYMGDRFDPSNVNGGSLYASRHVWLPITFPTNNTMSISWKNSWNIDTVFPTVIGPSSATNLTATKSGLTVNLSWTNNESNPYTLYLDRASNSVFTSGLISELLDSASTTFSDTFISNGNTYYYRIRTVNGNGPSYSSTVTADFSSTPDTTGPTISSLSSVPSQRYATISWNTDENSSSIVDFGLTTSYGSSTPQFDTSPRVSNHSVSILNLLPCTFYHARVRSLDSSLNNSTSSDITFITLGCTGNASVSTTTVKTIVANAGGTIGMTQSSSGINLVIPPAFASGTNIDFQIKKMDNTSFFNSVSSVPNKRAVGTQVYNLKALSDATTTVSSFSKALTVTMNYSSSDVDGINESSLIIKRWDGSNWNDLENCTVDTGNKSVTCETSNFSDFAIFGDEQSTSSESTTTTTNNSTQSTTISSSGGKVQIKLPESNSISISNLDKIFKKNLDLGSKGNDVRYLQSILVELGYLKHSITGTYATLTKQAVRKFQIDHKIKPVTGTFGPKTKAVIMKLLRK